jgi:hypothetical protein
LTYVNWLVSYMGLEYVWIRFMLASYMRDTKINSFDVMDDELPEQWRLLGEGKVMPPSFNSSGQAIVQTHFLPKADVMRRYQKLTKKIVYVSQDPREIIVRGMQAMNVPEVNRVEFAKSVIAHRGIVPGFGGLVLSGEDDHGLGCGTWQQNSREWTYPAAVHRYFPDAEVLTVKYQDISDDPGTSLSRIVRFLGLASGEEGRIERAVANGSMENFHAVQRATRTQGLHALRDPGSHPPGDQMEHAELSWSGLGADVEAAYQQWQQDDDEFGSCVRHLGYS